MIHGLAVVVFLSWYHKGGKRRDKISSSCIPRGGRKVKSSRDLSRQAMAPYN